MDLVVMSQEICFNINGLMTYIYTRILKRYYSYTIQCKLVIEEYQEFVIVDDKGLAHNIFTYPNNVLFCKIGFVTFKF